MLYNISQGMNKAPFLVYPEFFFSARIYEYFPNLSNLIYFSSFSTTPSSNHNLSQKRMWIPVQ